MLASPVEAGIASQPKEALNLSKDEFERDFNLSDSNWFYSGMSRIWESFLASSVKCTGAAGKALDLGCGTGGKTGYLKRFCAKTFGLDISIDALGLCKKRGSTGLSQANVEKLPFKDGSFFMVSAFDVLEHVEDEAASLAEVNRILDDKGLLLLALPAFPVLWSQHDIANFHKRRYSAGYLCKKLEDAGFEVERMTYANTILFPAVLIYRLIQYRFIKKNAKPKRTRVENLPPLLNGAFSAILRFESFLIKSMDLPFGVALLCVAKKKSLARKVDNYLRGILICPHCGASFTAQGPERFPDTELVCNNCSSRYPVVAGVPRFVDHDISNLKKRTANNFGYSWKTFSEYHKFYGEQFLDWIWPVTGKDISGKVVLDAACGNGRHVYEAARLGAKEVVGFDLSEAIDVASANTREFNNVHLLQADIYNIPLKPIFDYIYCIGVLHHLPDPEDGFKKLADLLRIGGRISVWVYAREGNFIVRKFVDPFRLHVASRLPMPVLYMVSYPFALALFAWSRFVIRPLNKFTLTRRGARHIPLNDYLYSISGFNFRSIFNIVFDQLVAVKTNYISKNEIEGWFRRAGLADMHISLRNGNGWRGTAIKSA